MRAFIRKSKDKDKDKNASSRVPDVAPSLSLPLVSVSDDTEQSPTSPVMSSISLAPSVKSFSSGTSSYGVTPPLYARFARGPSVVDFNDTASLTPPVSPPQALRHRASTDSAKGGGSGFRSSGVRDEVERLAVTKRERTGATKSTRSVSSSNDSPRPRVVNPQTQMALPRPPTPPPPSPLKPVYEKYTPIVSPANNKSLPATPPRSRSPLQTTSRPTTPSVSNPPSVLTPPSSPAGTARQAYSPLAAFYSNPGEKTQTQGQEQTDPEKPQPSLLPAPASLTQLEVTKSGVPSPPLATAALSPVSSPLTPNTLRNSPLYGPGMASMLRAASRNGRPTSPVSPNAMSGAANASSPSNGTTTVVEPLAKSDEESPSKALKRGSYFSQYPDRDKHADLKQDEHNASASESGSISNHDIHPSTATSISSNATGNSVSSFTINRKNLVVETSASADLFTNSDNVPTPRATTYFNPPPTLEKEDAAFQAFAASLPTTVNMSTNLTSPRIARGNRLSRQLTSGSAEVVAVDNDSVANPGPNTPSMIPLPVPIPSSEERGSISRNSSTSGSLSGLPSTPSTPTSSRIGRAALGKTESVRDRVRALEEERERVKEREKVIEKRTSLKERKASQGATGGVLAKDRDKTNGAREREVNLGRERKSSPSRSRKVSLGKAVEETNMAGIGAVGIGMPPPVPAKEKDASITPVTQTSIPDPSPASTTSTHPVWSNTDIISAVSSTSSPVPSVEPSVRSKPSNSSIQTATTVSSSASVVQTATSSGHQSKPSTLDLDDDPFARSPPPIVTPRNTTPVPPIPTQTVRNDAFAFGTTHSPPPPAHVIPRIAKHHATLPALAYNPRESTMSIYSEEGEDEPETQELPRSLYPLERHTTHPYLLHCLLRYLSYTDVLALLSANKSIRHALSEIRELREEVLERFLATVGYTRWVWVEKEPLTLSLNDLNAYLRGVSTPMHEYASIADAFIAQGSNGVPTAKILRSLAASCRSFTRLVLRLREQAEAEYAARSAPNSPEGVPIPTSPLFMGTSISPPSSAGGHSRNGSFQQTFRRTTEDSDVAFSRRKFSSPLFRIHHAPLLRLFVPSPNGAWLSDESVLECEKELKRAGVVHLMRAGDIIWDTAVADEMNAGRLIWDGNYLIDLDYSYSQGGELPRYLHSLSFSPSYFHKVIRSTGNPLVQVDISPWGAEIAQNVQLVQDRVISETPQGAQHSILRWTHRSRFQINHGTPIAGTEGMVVDSKWVGIVVIETEGTNEGLADLLGRCGEEASQKALAATGGLSNKLGKGDAGRVFRILRAKSRPGEIWMRCVRERERLS